MQVATPRRLQRHTLPQTARYLIALQFSQSCSTLYLTVGVGPQVIITHHPGNGHLWLLLQNRTLGKAWEQKHCAAHLALLC